MNKLTILGLSMLALALYGCAGSQEPPPEPIAMETPDEQPAESPDHDSAQTKEPPVVELVEPQPVDPQPVEEEAPQESVPQETQQGEVQEYVPTEETYNRTFTEVEQTISKLNEIIRRQDFADWKSYLTESYLQEVSDPETLAEVSNHRILKRNDIVLDSLEDYFRFVVAPSRSNARLDDLVFRNDENVEAIMIIQGQRVILYQLRKVDGTWKIDIF